MNNWHTESTDSLCAAILSLETQEECYAFIEDICTIKEIHDLSQRLSVARLLAEGESYSRISQLTGASTATISRVGRCYQYGAGGYRTVLEKTGERGDDR